MGHFKYPIPQIHASTQTETPKIIDHINILSLLRKRDKKKWKYPLNNTFRRYTETSRVRFVLYLYELRIKQNTFYLHLKSQIDQRTLPGTSAREKLCHARSWNFLLLYRHFPTCGSLPWLSWHSYFSSHIRVRMRYCADILSFNIRLCFMQICFEHNNDNVKWPPM